MQALTSWVIRLESHSQKTLRMPALIWSLPGAAVLAAFLRSVPTSLWSTCWYASPPFAAPSYGAVSTGAEGEMASQQGSSAVLLGFCPEAVLVDEHLAGLADPDRGVPCGRPYVIALGVLQEFIPEVLLCLADGSSQLASCALDPCPVPCALSSAECRPQVAQFVIPPPLRAGALPSVSGVLVESGRHSRSELLRHTSCASGYRIYTHRKNGEFAPEGILVGIICEDCSKSQSYSMGCNKGAYQPGRHNSKPRKLYRSSEVAVDKSRWKSKLACGYGL